MKVWFLTFMIWLWVLYLIVLNGGVGSVSPAPAWDKVEKKDILQEMESSTIFCFCTGPRDFTFPHYQDVSNKHNYV